MTTWSKGQDESKVSEDTTIAEQLKSLDNLTESVSNTMSAVEELQKNDEDYEKKNSEFQSKITSAIEKIESSVNKLRASNTATTTHSTAAEVVDPYTGDFGFMRYCNHVYRATNREINVTEKPDETLIKFQAKRSEELSKTLGAQFASGNINVNIESEGGFLIPPEHVNEMLRIMRERNGLITRTKNLPMSGNTVAIPFLNVESFQTSGVAGGVVAYWEPEAATFTASQPNLGLLELKLKKLTALTAVTNEMMSDSPISVAALVRDLFTRAIEASTEYVIINGTGAGQPQGLLNAACKVPVSKETGQQAGTIEYANITKMYSRMAARSVPGAVWIYNQAILPQLLSMGLAVGAGGGPTWVNGIATAPPMTILGIPMIASDYCPTLGTEGDLILANLDDYLMASKGLSFAESMHLYFNSDRMAFRITTRMDGRSWWKQKITPGSGDTNNTLSHIVTLETRS